MIVNNKQVNKVKVVKENYGFELGAILTWNELTKEYDYIKRNEEVTEEGTITTTIISNVSDDIVGCNQDLFKPINDDGTEIVEVTNPTVEINISNLLERVEKLEEEVKYLDKKLTSISIYIDDTSAKLDILESKQCRTQKDNSYWWTSPLTTIKF